MRIPEKRAFFDVPCINILNAFYNFLKFQNKKTLATKVMKRKHKTQSGRDIGQQNIVTKYTFERNKRETRQKYY